MDQGDCGMRGPAWKARSGYRENPFCFRMGSEAISLAAGNGGELPEALDRGDDAIMLGAAAADDYKRHAEMMFYFWCLV
ncbi:hypothetical protein ACFQUU_17755 [Herbaspirillum sp. GCM10030257]|uniref:hypothetical protein n=1 Tax=Herbaspirillum sp. GCM10030257 TaxID=3273393 RepID=UPI0036136589